MLRMKIHHIDVGQSDSTLIVLCEDGEVAKDHQTPQWKHDGEPQKKTWKNAPKQSFNPPKSIGGEVIVLAILIDAGHNPETGEEVFRFCKRKLTPKLLTKEDKGAKCLDAIILSHNHSDHTYGLPKIFQLNKEEMEGRKIISPETIVMYQKLSKGVRKLIKKKYDEKFEERRLKVDVNMSIEYRKFEMQCISDGKYTRSKAQMQPADRQSTNNKRDFSDVNQIIEEVRRGDVKGADSPVDPNISLGWLVKFNGLIYYTAGDAHEGQETQMLSEVNELHAMKISHHGSPTPGGAALKKLHKNGIVVISAGHDDKFRHPRTQTISQVMTGDNSRVLLITGLLDEYGIIPRPDAYDPSGETKGASPWSALNSQPAGNGVQDENATTYGYSKSATNDNALIPYFLIENDQANARAKSRRLRREFLASAITLGFATDEKGMIDVSMDAIIPLAEFKKTNPDEQKVPKPIKEGLPVRTSPLYIDPLVGTMNEPRGASGYAAAARLSDELNTQVRTSTTPTTVNRDYIKQKLEEYLNRPLPVGATQRDDFYKEEVGYLAAQILQNTTTNDQPNSKKKKGAWDATKIDPQSDIGKLLKSITENWQAPPGQPVHHAEGETPMEIVRDDPRIVNRTADEAIISPIHAAAQSMFSSQASAKQRKVRAKITANNTDYLLIKQTWSHGIAS